MFDLSRRQMLVSGTLAGAVSIAAPGRALAQAAAQAAAPAAGAAWDLTDLFPTDAAWEAERQAILKDIPALKNFEGKLGSAATLKAALQAQSDINRRMSRLYTYASLKADEDRRVAANQERKQKAQDVFTAFGEATAWSSPEIVALGAERIDALIAADPGLNKFAFGLHNTLRQAQHTLSPDEEQLLAAAGKGVGRLHGSGRVRRAPVPAAQSHQQI
jgi:oligoendopeptidase F